MLPVFIEDEALVIKQQAMTLSDRKQGFDTCLHAFTPDVWSLAVGDDRDVGVHNCGTVHRDSLFFRSRAALLMAAISPKSSPKKSSGQFLMLPKRSSSSGVRRDSPPSSVEK